PLRIVGTGIFRSWRGIFKARRKKAWQSRDRPPDEKEFVSSVLGSVVPSADRRVDKGPSRGHSGFSVCRDGRADVVARNKDAASRLADPGPTTARADRPRYIPSTAAECVPVSAPEAANPADPDASSNLENNVQCACAGDTSEPPLR